MWVRGTGRKLDLSSFPWLDGPVGGTEEIGKDFFTDYGRLRGLNVVRVGSRGLLQDIGVLTNPCIDGRHVSDAVRAFYEQTSEYELDAWSEWRGFFRPFGIALAKLFSRRLQQLNLPLSSLDSSKGISSDVLQLCDPRSGEVLQTAWIRQLRSTGNILYAASYSVCQAPGFNGNCIKVVFPLPNGNAIVIMKPEVDVDGSLSVISAGQKFGDPGFYFTVHDGHGRVWARYVRSMKEVIKVYVDGPHTVRADHHLWIWGQQFLRLHYRMRRQT